MKLSKRTISNIATYILGLAIGLVLVGVIMQMKQKMVQPNGANQPVQQQSSPIDGDSDGSS